MEQRHRVVILGGGFAGIYAALELDKEFAARPGVEGGARSGRDPHERYRHCLCARRRGYRGLSTSLYAGPQF